MGRIAEGHQEGLDAQQQGGQRERALVGAAHDEGLLGAFAHYEPRHFEIFGQWVSGIRVRHHQLVDLIQAADGRPDGDRCAIWEVFHLTAAGLRQGGSTVFQHQHILPKLAPGLEMAFGHRLPTLEIFRVGHTRGAGGDDKIVQSNWHPIGDAAAQDGINAFD